MRAALPTSAVLDSGAPGAKLGAFYEKSIVALTLPQPVRHFQFGRGEVVAATGLVELPFCPSEDCGWMSVKVSVIDDDFPPLFGLDAQAQCGVIVDAAAWAAYFRAEGRLVSAKVGAYERLMTLDLLGLGC
eukprot:gene46930-19883_t